MQRTCQISEGLFPQRRIAAPSWVIPASLAENCRFLAGRVHEVALLFFDSNASLAYGPDDLPESLADLPLSFHIHLPQNLPWQQPDQAAAICMTLLGKAARLAAPPHSPAVLHPPPHEPSSPLQAARQLERFATVFLALGGDISLIHLENTRENDLAELAAPAAAMGFRFCPDSGHMLAYAQEHILHNQTILDATGIAHFHAPGPDGKDSHRPLTELDKTGMLLCRQLAQAIPPCATIVLEHFDWAHLALSLPVFASWLLPVRNS